MDIIKMARELGAAIQQDERYLNFKKAREANEADKPLNDLIGVNGAIWGKPSLSFTHAQGSGRLAPPCFKSVVFF